MVELIKMPRGQKLGKKEENEKGDGRRQRKQTRSSAAEQQSPLRPIVKQRKRSASEGK